MPSDQEIAEAAFAAFQRGDIDAAFADVTPNFEFDNRTGAPGAEGVWRGREGWLAMMGKVLEAFSEYHLDLIETQATGHQVELKLLEVGRGVSSGIETERRIVLRYSFENGEVFRIEAFLEDEDAA